MSRSALARLVPSVLLALSALACRAAPAEATHERHAPAQALPQPPADQAALAPSEATFAGTWNTTYGTMKLSEGKLSEGPDGTSVSGLYLYGGRSTIEGERVGRVLRAHYTEPDGTRGRAVFELAEDGASFRGRWRADLEQPLDLSDPRAAEWQGSRVVPLAGRTWLVILEAHWETTLGEHEYSYGEMLRAFFERVPTVEVRHRFFHDRADLERFCLELAGLAEPVVLYISSHGSPAGVEVGGETIDGTTIGRALAEAGPLRLVHFGSCEVLRGDEPGKLLAAAAPHAPFPISGFRAVADWAGSAIVDFTYLTLVLEQELEPAEALRFTRAAVSFAGPPQGEDAPISGSDLALWGE